MYRIVGMAAKNRNLTTTRVKADKMKHSNSALVHTGLWIYFCFKLIDED